MWRILNPGKSFWRLIGVIVLLIVFVVIWLFAGSGAANAKGGSENSLADGCIVTEALVLAEAERAALRNAGTPLPTVAVSDEASFQNALALLEFIARKSPTVAIERQARFRQMFFTEKLIRYYENAAMSTKGRPWREIREKRASCFRYLESTRTKIYRLPAPEPSLVQRLTRTASGIAFDLFIDAMLGGLG